MKRKYYPAETELLPTNASTDILAFNVSNMSVNDRSSDILWDEEF